MTQRLILFLALVLIAAACQPQDTGPLPTLAVLPSPTPEARPLAFWEAAAGELTTPTAYDLYRFNAAAGDNIRLRALGPVNLTLRGPDGAPLMTDNPDFETRITQAGAYLVFVTLAGAESGRYELGLAYTDRPSPADFTPTPPEVVVDIPTPTPPFADLGARIGDLTPGRDVGGRFQLDAPQRHVYTFTGTPGQYITLSMGRVNGMVDPQLTLYDPDGQPIATDGNSGGNRDALLRNIRLPAAGLYSVLVTGGGQQGDYILRLQSTGDPLPVTPVQSTRPTLTPFNPALTPTIATAAPDARLQDHVPVQGRLTRGGDFARYLIDVTAGDFVTIGVRPQAPDQLRLLVEVYDPDGVLVRQARSSTDLVGDTVLLPITPMATTGTYAIFITTERDSQGDYVLAYGTGTSYADTRRGIIEADTPYESAIRGRGQREVWYAELEAGDVITAVAVPLNTALDPVLELVAPDGTLIASDDNSGGFPSPLLDAITIPVSGVYELRVTAANAATAGPYRIIWRYVAAAPTPTPDAPRYRIMTVADVVPEGQYRFYPFQGQAGQTVRIQVLGQPDTGFDPVAALLGPDGREIATGDDSGGDLNPRFRATLPADGTYTVRVSGYLSGGAFDVIVDALLE